MTKKPFLVSSPLVMLLIVLLLLVWAGYLAWKFNPVPITPTFTPSPSPTLTAIYTPTNIPFPTFIVTSPRDTATVTPALTPTPTPTSTPTETPVLPTTPTLSPMPTTPKEAPLPTTPIPTSLPTKTPTPPTTTPTLIPTSTSTPTEVPSLTATPTPISLLPPVIIDDQETQLDKTKLPANNYRLLRWRPWSEEAPEGWYYLISFLPANNPDSVFFTKKVHQEEITYGEGDNVDWLTYSFDILELPENINSCYPYWDVVVAIDGLINCPTERSPRGTCRLTEFSERQQALATERPGVCPGGGDGSSRKGSNANNRGPDDLDH